jgi:predicted signal transduction protein with EAL and GGDEF domain
MAIVFGGLLVAPEPPPLWRFALALALLIAAQQLVLYARVGAAVLALTWGEAALVIGLVLVPAGWLPLVFATGALLGAALRRLRGNDVSPLSATLRAAANFTLAGAVGAAVGFVVADPYASPLTPATAVGLVLAAVAFQLTASITIAVRNTVRLRVGFVGLLVRVLQRKALMFLGNVALGLTVIALAYADWRWLVALAPAIWLLHRTYAHWLRVAEHRRMWGAFAGAARSLNQPDVESVALAGVRGAREVFAVGRVEVELGEEEAGRGGGRRSWVGDETGEVRQLPAPGAGVAEPADRCLAPATIVPLLVGADEVGQLRLHYPKLAGPGTDDDAALLAYGDALAAAVHEAATHHELQRLLAHSASDAQHDPLTGLFNRAALLARGETAVQLTERAAPVTLLLVDVDHFREINETLGHAAGDEVLQVTAQRLQAAAGPGELVARLGGDEFALLVTEPPATSDGASGGAGRNRTARRSAARNGGVRGNGAAWASGPAAGLRRGRELVRSLAEEANVRGVPVSIGVTVGVVVAPAGTADLAELLRRADVAMYHVRHGGGAPAGGAVGWYDSAHDAGSTDRPALLAELREALDHDDQLVLALQPVVDLATGAATQLEALVRWQHPRRGLLPPSEFVRAVENSDLLETFTEYIVDKALATAARLAKRGRAMPIAVNLSARSLLDPRLPRAVGALLRKHRVPGRRLLLEITETVVASELPGIQEVLAGLRALGVRLAVDDFGTGHASLAFLTRVALDEVKVDRAFVTQMDRSAEAAAIVRTTVELGRELGLRVVAEGVETAEQRERLGALGCTAAQGFHFAEPIPADVLLDRADQGLIHVS